MAKEQWWGTPNRVSNRLRLEVDMMRATFADTFRLVVPKRDLLYWVGDVEVNLRGIPQRLHTLKILYPEEYPNRPAEAYVLKPTVYSEKHQFEDGQLCLFNPKKPFEKSFCCLKSSESPNHEMHHHGVNHGIGGVDPILIIFAQAAIVT